MRMRIPFTGTILTKNPLSGDPNDPIRMVDLNLGDVHLQVISIDVEDETMEVEVTPNPLVRVPGDPPTVRARTAGEKILTEDIARALSIGPKTKAELYAISGNKKPTHPPTVIE